MNFDGKMILKILYQPENRIEVYEGLIAVKAGSIEEALNQIKNDKFLFPHREIIDIKKLEN